MIRKFTGVYRFLSNFAPAEVCYDGITYPTVEQAYQAAKSDDCVRRAQIAIARTPGEAKRIGRGGPVRDGWEDLKVGIMRSLLQQKFALPEYRTQLRATGDQALYEGNTWGDQFWGVDDATGIGENRLGQLLMSIRVEDPR